MPKYFDYKVYGYFLYYTSSCIVEAMHVHASDSKLTEAGSAKFFVKANGDTIVQKTGKLNQRDIIKLKKFIKNNYLEMYNIWRIASKEGFYNS